MVVLVTRARFSGNQEILGSAIGLVAGYTICFLTIKYHWPSLDDTVYSMAYVPFEPRWIDGLWIAGLAILVSFLARLIRRETLREPRRARCFGTSESSYCCGGWSDGVKLTSIWVITSTGWPLSSVC